MKTEGFLILLKSFARDFLPFWEHAEFLDEAEKWSWQKMKGFFPVLWGEYSDRIEQEEEH